MHKKVFLGTAILAIILGGVAISLIPLTFAVAEPPQSSDVKYYPVRYGPRWRTWPYRYTPYSGYWDYGWGTYPWRGNACPGMWWWGYGAYPSWQQYPPPSYWNYSN
ncbi:hypothetical protein KEJ39_06980 [Candidatus Bathyarchaeota archaeon]|nr:hypothetical protein [Candidatus Bathyarchaeota archaeon]